MKRMLINAQDELRVAIVADGLLIDLDIERPDIEQKKANIYKGRISSIEPSLNAVFVDYGSERHGFLPLKEISKAYFQNQSDDAVREGDINKLLRLGQEVVVQVDKEERGTKGAALTTFISLAGSFLVLMPNNPRGGGISRRIEGEERDMIREHLSKLDIPDGMSVIIRTAGMNRSIDELKWDLSFLLRYWDAIQQASEIKKAPYLIHQESDVIIRAIRDNLRHDVNELYIDEPSAFERAKNYLQQVRPDFVDKIKLYSDSLPLFSRFQVERQIELAYQREVQLPSGGSIVIDHTEALVSIDINSARATKGGNIEETATHTNLEAAEEISRQLRIRDIGGLVVIDFIDMMQAKNQREVENKLREYLQADRARIQIGRISRFGLLEMSRQRLRSALTRSIHVTCPRCDGQGTIRGVESLAHSIVYLVQEQAVKGQNIQIQVQVPVDVATYILNEKRQLITDLQKETSSEILIIPNQHLQSPHYTIKHVKIDVSTRQHVSYKLVKFPKPETSSQQSSRPQRRAEEPAMNEFLSSTPDKPKPSHSSGNFITRIFSAIFGATDGNPSSTTATPKKSAQSPGRRTSSRHTSESSNRDGDERGSSSNRRRRNSGAQRQQNRRGRGGNSGNSGQRQDRQDRQDRQPRQGQRKPRSSANKADTPVSASTQPPTNQPTATAAPKKDASPAVEKIRAEASLVKTPSPLETNATNMNQVRTQSNSPSQTDLQAQAREHQREIKSETKAAPDYKGLGDSSDASLQQVRTKSD